MDLKTMFPNLTVMWTRWSDYHVISQYGMHFLVPTPDATSLTYDCTQQPGSLVADALDLAASLPPIHRRRTACALRLRPTTACSGWTTQETLMVLHKDMNSLPPCAR